MYQTRTMDSNQTYSGLRNNTLVILMISDDWVLNQWWLC